MWYAFSDFFFEFVGFYINFLCSTWAWGDFDEDGDPGGSG
jgi:hypothetical protein